MFLRQLLKNILYNVGVHCTKWHSAAQHPAFAVISKWMLSFFSLILVCN